MKRRVAEIRKRGRPDNHHTLGVKLRLCEEQPSQANQWRRVTLLISQSKNVQTPGTGFSLYRRRSRPTSANQAPGVCAFLDREISKVTRGTRVLRAALARGLNTGSRGCSSQSPASHRLRVGCLSGLLCVSLRSPRFNQRLF